MIIDNIDTLKYDYLFNNKSDNIINILYNNIEEADKYVTNISNSISFNYNITKIDTKSQIPLPSSHDSHFFPDKIKKYIYEESTFSLQFTCKIKNRFITVNFVIFEKITQSILFTLKQYIKLIYIWIYIVDDFSLKKCSNKLDVYIYLTPFKKQLPNNQLQIIDSRNVNTAYTTGCQKETEIILYRKEEWFKVFIHETFHCFGLDFSDMNLTSINKSIKNIFNVNIEYKIYESYCETWGRIFNTMIYTYFSLHNNNKRLNSKLFRELFKQNMIVEAYHSLYQSLNILIFMDMNFKIITDKNENHINICNQLYREKTAVFSYYVITSLLLNNYINFLNWCDINNNMLIQFKKTPGNLNKYVEFIQDSCKNKHINKNINELEKNITKNKVTKNLKMSILEIL